MLSPCIRATRPRTSPSSSGTASRSGSPPVAPASPPDRVSAPNVPTYGEMGFPNVYSGSWVGFFAPAKTPEAVIARLNAEINEIMKEPEVQQKVKSIGFDPMIKTQVEAADYFKSEVATWGKM